MPFGGQSILSLAEDVHGERVSFVVLAIRSSLCYSIRSVAVFVVKRVQCGEVESVVVVRPFQWLVDFLYPRIGLAMYPWHRPSVSIRRIETLVASITAVSRPIRTPRPRKAVGTMYF